MSAGAVDADVVVSRDGTRIGVLHEGTGPGIVLVQGAMGTVDDYARLARELSTTFTVHRPERRGRGISPRPYSSDHDIARDVEDLDAVLTATGATRVFGLSSGAVITLEAARTLPRISHFALYEPPFHPDGIAHDGVGMLGRQIDRGALASALVTSLRVSATAPPALLALPDTVATALATVVLAAQSRRAAPGTSLRELLPGIRYDFHDVAGVDGRMDDYSGVALPVLLLRGTRSAPYLQESARALAELLPDPRLVTLDGLDHGSPWDAAGAGPIADALRSFFS